MTINAGAFVGADRLEELCAPMTAASLTVNSASWVLQRVAASCSHPNSGVEHRF
jgi:hypothetical protein